MDHTLEKILARVQKPGRYVGGEYNAVQKDKSTVDCRFAFCFPDTYEIGMSNLGMRILYGVMNEMDGVWCCLLYTSFSFHWQRRSPGAAVQGDSCPGRCLYS